MHAHQGRTAVYRLYDSNDQLIYVGITNDPARRWRLHAHEKSWWGDVVIREVEWRSTREEAELVERDVIGTERPKWNVYGGAPERGRPGLTSGKLQKGWEPDDHILALFTQYEDELRNLGAARDELEAEIVRVMRTGVSATRISKFLPLSTVTIQAIGKRAGVPLLRKAAAQSLPKAAESNA